MRRRSLLHRRRLGLPGTLPLLGLRPLLSHCLPGCRCLLPSSGLAFALIWANQLVGRVHVELAHRGPDESLCMLTHSQGVFQGRHGALVALPNLGHGPLHVCHLGRQVGTHMGFCGQGSFQIGTQLMGLEPCPRLVTILHLKDNGIADQLVGDAVSKCNERLLDERVTRSLEQAPFHGQQERGMVFIRRVEIAGMIGVTEDGTGMLVIPLVPMGLLALLAAVHGQFAALASFECSRRGTVPARRTFPCINDGSGGHNVCPPLGGRNWPALFRLRLLVVNGRSMHFWWT